MNAERITQLAHSDPLPNLTANLGTTFVAAKQRLEALVTSLRELDDLQKHLVERGIDIDLDLGPIGNAAASVRRDLEKQQGGKFELPKAS